MDNKDVTNFALGLIVAAVLFLLLRRELGNHAATPEIGFSDANGNSNRNSPPSGGCGCGGSGTGGGSQVIPIGGQSYNSNSPYGGSSVVSQTAKVVNISAPAPRVINPVGGGGALSAPAASSGGYSSSGGSSGGGYAVIGGGFANAF